jgi:hypothetical protein
MAITRKICLRCGIEKDIVNFNWAIKDKQRHSQCKECRTKSYKKRKAKDPIGFAKRHRENIARNRKENPEKYRERNIFQSFHISLSKFDSILKSLLAVQGETCWVCGRSGKMRGQFKRNEKGRRIVIDHDHNTGEIRGLLCDLCNTSLGKLDDDPEIVLNLYNYIREFKKDIRYDKLIG